jgi:hypothetical protein
MLAPFIYMWQISFCKVYWSGWCSWFIKDIGKERVKLRNARRCASEQRRIWLAFAKEAEVRVQSMSTEANKHSPSPEIFKCGNCHGKILRLEH